MADLLLQRAPQFALAEDDEVQVWHLPHGQWQGLEQIPLALVVGERPDVDDDRHAVGQPELPVQVRRRDAADAVDIDAVVHHADAIAGDAVGVEHLGDGLGRGDEPSDLPVLPAGKRVAVEVEVDAPRRNELRYRRDGAERQRRGGHGECMRVVCMHDVGPVRGEQP